MAAEPPSSGDVDGAAALLQAPAAATLLLCSAPLRDPEREEARYVHEVCPCEGLKIEETGYRYGPALPHTFACRAYLSMENRANQLASASISGRWGGLPEASSKAAAREARRCWRSSMVCVAPPCTSAAAERTEGRHCSTAATGIWNDELHLAKCSNSPIERSADEVATGTHFFAAWQGTASLQNPAFLGATEGSCQENVVLLVRAARSYKTFTEARNARQCHGTSRYKQGKDETGKFRNPKTRNINPPSVTVRQCQA